MGVAPEVMCRQNHGIVVDYFAVGVMAFECMFGRVAFSYLQLTIFLKIEAIHWKVKIGNKRPHIVEANSNQEERSTERLVT